MASTILTEHVVSISELKANPQTAVNFGDGAPVAVLNHNKPVFYCLTPELFEAISEALEDAELAQIVRDRANQKRVRVNINDL